MTSIERMEWQRRALPAWREAGRAAEDAPGTEIVATVMGTPVTRTQMLAAFNRVQRMVDAWKGPIDAVVDIAGDRELLTIREAIIFFSGSVPTFTVRPGGTLPGCRYRVQAAGYYATVGGLTMLTNAQRLIDAEPHACTAATCPAGNTCHCGSGKFPGIMRATGYCCGECYGNRWCPGPTHEHYCPKCRRARRCAALDGNCRIFPPHRDMTCNDCAEEETR